MFDIQFSHLNSQALSVLKASNKMDSTLLITGATGTGKSHMAQAVHRASEKRGTGRWFKVNLATLSENLIESELFGHERGAFTGADSRRVGRLEACNGGTVFLDEIGELSLRLQAKLLDFIQYKKISPVGSNREIELDVRIIAATNRNLEAAVKAGEFRSDLFHRLNVFHVRMPDLALNPRAVLNMAREFLNFRTGVADKNITGFSRDVEHVLWHYTWPGNIRELENMIEFAVAMESSDKLTLQSLPLHMQEYARETLKLESGDAVETESESLLESAHVTRREVSANAVGYMELPVTMHESKDLFEKSYLEQALRLCAGQINLTSRRIGLNKVSLTEKIKRHGIDWRKIRYDSLGPALSAAN
jgi:DNA-binding NtrC family response regulator